MIIITNIKILYMYHPNSVSIIETSSKLAPITVFVGFVFVLLGIQA